MGTGDLGSVLSLLQLGDFPLQSQQPVRRGGKSDGRMILGWGSLGLVRKAKGMRWGKGRARLKGRQCMDFSCAWENTKPEKG